MSRDDEAILPRQKQGSAGAVTVDPGVTKAAKMRIQIIQPQDKRVEGDEGQTNRVMMDASELSLFTTREVHRSRRACHA